MSCSYLLICFYSFDATNHKFYTYSLIFEMLLMNTTKIYLTRARKSTFNKNKKKIKGDTTDLKAI